MAEEKIIETPNKRQHMSPSKVRKQFSRHRIRLSTGRSSSVRRNSVPGTLETEKESIETEPNINKENNNFVSKFENRHIYPPKVLQKNECSLGPLSKNVIRVTGLSNMYKNSQSQRSSLGTKDGMSDSKPITLVFKKSMLNKDINNKGDDLPVAILAEGQKINKFASDSKLKPETRPSAAEDNRLSGLKSKKVDTESERLKSSQDEQNDSDMMKEPPKNSPIQNNGQSPEFPSTHRKSEGSVSSFSSQNSEMYQRNTNPQMKIKENNLKTLDEKAAVSMHDLYDSNVPLYGYPDETFKNNYFEAYDSRVQQTNHLQTENSQHYRDLNLDLAHFNNSNVQPETELTPKNDRISVNMPELTAFFMNQSRPISEHSPLNGSQNAEKSAERSQITERSELLSSSRINSMVSTARNSARRGTNQQEQCTKNEFADNDAQITHQEHPFQASLPHIQLSFKGEGDARDKSSSLSQKDESLRKDNFNPESGQIMSDRSGDLQENSEVHASLKVDARNETASPRENMDNIQRLPFIRKTTPSFSLNDSEDQSEDFGIEAHPHKDQSPSNSSSLFPAITAGRDVWDSNKEEPKNNSAFQIDKTEMKRPINFWSSHSLQQRKDTEENKTNSKSMFETGNFGQNAKELSSILGMNEQSMNRSNANEANESSAILDNYIIPQYSSKPTKETRFRPRESYIKTSPGPDLSARRNQRQASENSDGSNSSEIFINHTAPLPDPQSNLSESSHYSSRGQNRSTPARFHLNLEEKKEPDSLQLGEIEFGNLSNKSSKASHDLEPLSESGIQPDNMEPSSEFGHHRASFYLEITSEKSSPKAHERHFKRAAENKEPNSEPSRFFGRLREPTQSSTNDYAAETSDPVNSQISVPTSQNKLPLKTTSVSSSAELSNRQNNVDAFSARVTSRAESKQTERSPEPHQRNAAVQTELDSQREDSSRSQPRKMFETYQQWAAYKSKLKSENKPDSTVPNSQRTSEYVSVKDGSSNGDTLNGLFSERYFQDRDALVSHAPNLIEETSKQNHTAPSLEVETQMHIARKLPDRSTHVRPSPKAEPFERISVELPTQKDRPDTNSIRAEKETTVEKPSQVLRQDSHEERCEYRESISMHSQQLPNERRSERRRSSLAEQRFVGNSELFSSNQQPQTSLNQRNHLYSPDSAGDCPFNSPFGSVSYIKQSAVGCEKSLANDLCDLSQSKIEPSVCKSEERYSHVDPSTIHFSFEEPVAMSLLSQLCEKNLRVLAPEPQISRLNPTPKPLQHYPDLSRDNSSFLSRATKNVPASQGHSIVVQQKAQPFKVQPISDYERILQKAMKKSNTKASAESKQGHAALQKAKSQNFQPKLQDPSKYIEQSQFLVPKEIQNPQGALPIDDYVLSAEFDNSNSQRFERKTYNGDKPASFSYADHSYQNGSMRKSVGYLERVSDRLEAQGPRFSYNFEASNRDQVSKSKEPSSNSTQNRIYPIEHNFLGTFQNISQRQVHNQGQVQLENNERSIPHQEDQFDQILRSNSNYLAFRASSEQERLTQRDSGTKVEGSDIHSKSDNYYRFESPFESDFRKMSRPHESSRKSVNILRDYLQITPGKRILQLKGQMVINEGEDQANVSLILDNSSPLPMTERKRNDPGSVGRIRKNYSREEWERIPRSSSAEQCNYSTASRAVRSSQRLQPTDWRKVKEENESNYQCLEDASKAFRQEINKLKNLTKRALYNEFEEQAALNPATAERNSYQAKEMLKENSMQLSNQNIFLDAAYAQSSGKPPKTDESSAKVSHRKRYSHERGNNFSTGAKKGANSVLSAAQKRQENVFLSSFEESRNKLKKKLFEPEYLPAPYNSETANEMTPFDAIDTATGDKNRRILREIRRRRENSSDKRSKFITEVFVDSSQCEP